MKLYKLISLEKTVEEILRKEPLAREDDCYLIFKVVQRTNPELAGATFANVMFNAKAKGISFESITRARRKVQRKHPELVHNWQNIKQKKEQKKYCKK